MEGSLCSSTSLQVAGEKRPPFTANDPPLFKKRPSSLEVADVTSGRISPGFQGARFHRELPRYHNNVNRKAEWHDEAYWQTARNLHHSNRHPYPDPWADLESRTPLRDARNYPIIVWGTILGVLLSRSMRSSIYSPGVQHRNPWP